MTAIDTPAKMRANRLIRVRRMANLSRKSMCENSDINLNTLKGWELARHGGLTQAGAAKVTQRLKQSGVLCHTEWLTDGTGPPPVIQYEQLTNLSTTSTLASFKQNDEHEEQAKMRLELALFEQHHQPILYSYINSQDLAPYYQQHDLVAGKITDQIGTCLGQYCLILLDNEQVIVGKLTGITHEILTLDTLLSAKPPYLSKQYIGPYQKCAVICWHRKHCH